MSKPDAIEQLFKDRADQLTVEPSSETWQKLNQRMQRPRHQLFWVRRLAAAVLLTLIGLAAFYTKGAQNNDLAQAPDSVEVIPYESESYTSTASTIRSYRALEEGESNRDLVAKNVRRPQLRVAPAYRRDS
ncbi:MAG: hypothetical protein AAFY91_05525 [Bacteroidota bacterium]